MAKFKIPAVIIFLAAFGYFFRVVFSGRLILPQVFYVGFLTIHYYGIIMALAALAGCYVALKRAPKYEVSQDRAEDILFWLIVGGFIGARLYHVASDFSYYRVYPLDILKVYNGGLSIYGAVFGGLLTLWIYKRLTAYSLQLTTLLDWLTPSLVLGQIIGRLGNFFNYEAFGYPTNLPWKMFVPVNFRPENYSQFAYFHPFFLYEIIGNILILFLLVYLEKFSTKGFKNRVPSQSLPSDKPSRVLGESNRFRPPALFFCYLLLYNVLRFFLEFLRIDSTFIYGLRLNVLTSGLLAILAIIGLFYTFRPHAKTS